MDYSLPDEKFVKVPGIIEIRWTSDDCEYYVVPTDLIEEQGKGLPDTYGKKDKRTKELEHQLAQFQGWEGHGGGAKGQPKAKAKSGGRGDPARRKPCWDEAKGKGT